MDSLPDRSIWAQNAAGRAFMSLPAKPWDIGALRARSLLVQAPSTAKRDMILEALAELPDPGETAPTRWLGQTTSEHQLSPAQPVVWRSETGQTAPPPQW